MQRCKHTRTYISLSIATRAEADEEEDRVERLRRRDHERLLEQRAVRDVREVGAPPLQPPQTRF
jgi:hypothetical protein